jgi:hypothetical protein
MSMSDLVNASDSPWSTDRIAAERRKFRRVIIAFQDLDDVRACVSQLQILVAQRVKMDDTIPKALVTSAIVGYGRCSTQSRGGTSVLRRLPETFEHALDPALRALHARLLRLRHTEFAHSDGDTADVTVGALPNFRTGALMPSARRLRADALSNVELAMFPKLLEQLHIYLYDELVRLNAELARYGDF